MDLSNASWNWVVIASAVVLGIVFVAVAFARNFLYICRPHEILIFSGRNHTTADGRTIGFRVVQGGRVWRIPIVEKVDRMDMRLISVPMTVQGAYSEGGIPLAVHAIANVKISSDPRHMHNAIERFLGRDRAEIARVAKETLEGHLRGVLATMTPEEVNEDRLKFATVLQEEAEDDLAKLGLQLDTLKIQHVADDRNYLDSIGRKRIAEILRTAEVAESDAVRAAQEKEAEAHARSEVAKKKAQAAVQQKQNELRRYKAELDAHARSEEERALAAAQAARAEAEKELQQIRGELEQLRLAADVTIPAEIDRRVRELQAAGRAAPIEADGRAQAEALAQIAAAWRETRGRAMDMYVLQNIDEIFAQVTKAAANLDAREVNLVDSGDGQTLPAYLAAYPAAVGALLAEVSRTLGIDIPGVLTGADRGNGARPTAPAMPGAPTSPPRAPSPEGGAL
ncbi:MAG: flotillin family protein [Deltaproteobacteria bacterium]|nr:MAG: flotillin family protein [Deltaproteobacteria bacterium]